MASDLPDLTGMLEPLPSTDTTENFTDAMEYVVGRVLIGTTTTALKVLDVANSLCVKVVLEATCDAPKTDYVLVKPQIEELKRCSVKLTRIDSVLSYVPKENLCQTLMHAGRLHTHSMCTPKPPKRGSHQSRRVSLQKVNYKDLDTTSEDGANSKKPCAMPVSTAGPSDEHIASQNSKTAPHPTAATFKIGHSRDQLIR